VIAVAGITVPMYHTGYLISGLSEVCDWCRIYCQNKI